MLPVLPHSFPTRRSSDLLATPSRGSQQSGDIAVASEASSTGAYRGAQGLRPEFIAELERQFGLDKPAHERFFLMIRNYLAFDFGESFFRGRPVVDLVIEKMDVSISIGLWTTDRKSTRLNSSH